MSWRFRIGRPRTLLGLTAAALVVVPASSASAAFHDLAINAEGSHGYDVSVFQPGGQTLEGDKFEPGLTFSKLFKDDSSYGAFYQSEHVILPRPASRASAGAIDGTKFKADFGKFGAINTTFDKRRTRTERLPPECTGDPFKVHEGVFEGKIKIHAERGISEIDVEAAKGTITVMADRPVCDGLFPDPGGSVNLFTSSGTPTFSAFQQKVKGDTLTSFSATQFGKHWNRSLNAPGAAESTFTYDNQLSTATVAPPGRFDGTATFTEAEFGLGTLTGDLTVRFPGFKPKPLANDRPASLYKNEPAP